MPTPGFSGPGRSPERLVSCLRERLVGGDTLEKDDAIALVERTLTVMQSNALQTFEQPIIPIDTAGARLETLYFDGPAELDWPAFAFAGNETYLALNRNLVTAPRNRVTA